MPLVWRSKLEVRLLDLYEIEAEMSRLPKEDRRIPEGSDKTQPWCELTAPLKLTSVRVGDYEIPQGFVYDQASLPGAIRWWLAPSDPRINHAACWHDWLSPWPGEHPPTFHQPDGDFWLSSVDAANELYDGMRASGAGSITAAIVSRAVKTFGPKF